MAWCRQATSHCLNQWCLVYLRLYASLGLNDLNVNVCFVATVKNQTAHSIVSTASAVKHMWWHIRNETYHIDGLMMQERCNSSALAIELRYVFLALSKRYTHIDQDVIVL